jgi:hypothetical protein
MASVPAIAFWGNTLSYQPFGTGYLVLIVYAALSNGYYREKRKER